MYVVAMRVLHHPQDAEDACLTSWEKVIKNLDKIDKIRADIENARLYTNIVFDKNGIKIREFYEEQIKRLLHELSDLNFPLYI